MSINIPELNIREDEIKLLLAIKLLEEGLVSLGKASEVAGYSEKAFVELLLRRGVPPARFSGLDLKKEMENASSDNR